MSIFDAFRTFILGVFYYGVLMQHIKKTTPLQVIKALGLEEGRALLYEAILEIEGTVASIALLGFSQNSIQVLKLRMSIPESQYLELHSRPGQVQALDVVPKN